MKLRAFRIPISFRNPTQSLYFLLFSLLLVSYNDVHGNSQISGPDTLCTGALGIYIYHDPFIVLEPPIKPVGITGPAEICPGEVATYSSTPTSPGYYLECFITGGTPATASDNSVAGDWDATGPWIVAVRQVQKAAPACPGDTLALVVQQKDIPTPAIDGLAHHRDQAQPGGQPHHTGPHRVLRHL